MSLLVGVRAALAGRRVQCEIIGARDAVQPLVHLYGGDEPPVVLPQRSVHKGAIARIGAATEQVLAQLRRAVSFSGELVESLATIVRRPSTSSWRTLPRLLERAGTDGIPIVVVLNFLLGFVMGYQATRVLKMYGANVFVADIVGVSVTRELAPLMTAIIVAGRSGAAFAAELGTMRVSEEIDALRTMGFQPMPYLVVPRILTLAIITPLLTLIADVVAVFGGLVVAATTLDLTPAGYLAELRLAVENPDVWTGLVKSVAFGIAIAIIGCQQGLATRGAASGVGRGTTATVVYCLFALVVIDTLFTMLFRGFGL
jgi:phospholipid/cholesterol/gamma-HCH transport system permease protein